MPSTATQELPRAYPLDHPGRDYVVLQMLLTWRGGYTHDQSRAVRTVTNHPAKPDTDFARRALSVFRRR